MPSLWVRLGSLFPPYAFWLIVIAALGNQYRAIFDGVHQTMAIINSAGPEAGQRVLEWFRLAYPGKWFALDSPDKLIDALEDGTVG